MIGFIHMFLIEGNLSQLVTQCLTANLSLVEFLRIQFLDLCFFLLYINDFYKCAPNIDFHLYADDSNLFCSHKSLQVLETIVNDQLNSMCMSGYVQTSYL